MLTVFKNMLSSLKYMLMCVFYNVKESVSNKKSFIIQTIAMFINNYVFIFFWQVLFNNKGGSINNINMNDILYLWSIPTMGYGIAHFCFGGLHRLCQDITNGNLDIYLTKPKNSLISVLTSDSVLSAMGDFLFGLVCGIVAVRAHPLKILFILLLAVISGFITVSALTCIRLLSFWIGDISNAAHKYTNSLFITLTIYPEGMFPGVIKFLMYTVIPAAYVAHVPVKLMNTFSVALFIALIAVLVLSWMLMMFMYNKGLKKYESGNGVTRR